MEKTFLPEKVSPQMSSWKTMWKRTVQDMKKCWQLYVFVLPAMTYIVIFHILPLYGIQIAFRDYRVSFGITGSDWAGMKHFITFFNSHYCSRLFTNTFLLNILSLLFTSTVPVFLALTLNAITAERIKKSIQTIIYVPHFISTVVLAGFLYIFFSPSTGIVNNLIRFLGGDEIHFMLEANWFRPLYIGSGLWQNAGWDSILYIASLTAIDPGLYEAATIDGATRVQKIRYIEIPTLVPIFVMMLILSCGRLLNSNTDMVLLMQTAGNSSVSEIIGTYVYNVGIGNAQFSYTAAIGLLINVVNLVLIMSVNKCSTALTGSGLF